MLKENYKEKVVPGMKEKFGYENEAAIPDIEKVVVNTSFGKKLSEEGTKKKELLDQIKRDLAAITGQKPVLTKARKSISAFDLVKGKPVGAKVTLRGKRMYDFLERLIRITLPRTKDFRGIDPDSVDEQGNLTIGIEEHIAFPEILPEEAEEILGLEITIVTSTKNKEEALELFKLINFPLREK